MCFVPYGVLGCKPDKCMALVDDNLATRIARDDERSPPISPLAEEKHHAVDCNQWSVAGDSTFGLSFEDSAPALAQNSPRSSEQLKTSLPRRVSVQSPSCVETEAIVASHASEETVKIEEEVEKSEWNSNSLPSIAGWCVAEQGKRTCRGHQTSEAAATTAAESSSICLESFLPTSHGESVTAHHGTSSSLITSQRIVAFRRDDSSHGEIAAAAAGTTTTATTLTTRAAPLLRTEGGVRAGTCSSSEIALVLRRKNCLHHSNKSSSSAADSEKGDCEEEGLKVDSRRVDTRLWFLLPGGFRRRIAAMGVSFLRVRKTMWQWRKWELGFVVIVALVIIASELRPPCLWPVLILKRHPKLTSSDNPDVTLVTAYFNLGSFEGSGKTFNFYKYLRWAEVYQYVQNPLVIFTDSEQVENLFIQTRSHLANRTKIITIHRADLRSFKHVGTLRRIFQDPAYPKHYPNTVIPEYPCSQHAKYELMQRALVEGYFPQTKYIAWLDIGYFRYLTQRKKDFYIVKPPRMNDEAIAMTEVERRDPSLSPYDVFRENLIWVGGGMSLGTRDAYRRFAEEYLTAVEVFMREGLSNTDQQVIYSMFTDVHNLTHKLATKIQTYSWWLDDVRNCWFYLGYLCYREVG